MDSPYVKESHATEGEQPTSWPKKFDTSNWGFLLATDGEQPVRGAAVAWNTLGVEMVEGRKHLAVLRDVRVHPNRRGEGTGTKLLGRAADRARERNYNQLKVETQNVKACSFYAKQGCELGVGNR